MKTELSNKHFISVEFDKNYLRSKIEAVLCEWNFHSLVFDADFQKVLDQCVEEL